MIIVTLNGPDNVGKTTHARWLNRLLNDSINLGTITNWNSNWQMLNDNSFSNWWFNQVSSEELFELIFDSYLNRKKQRKGEIIIEDRGFSMLFAVCAATHSIKHGLPVVDSLQYVQQFLQSRNIFENDKTLNILLLHEEALEKCSELSCTRDIKESSPIYRRYQELLGSILRHQLDEGLYETCIIRGDKTIAEINMEIIEFLKNKNPHIEATSLKSVPQIKILAGWSESGKSTAAKFIQLYFGSTRLKIDWILKTAARKKGFTNPYKWDEELQAEELINELIHYKVYNPFVTDYVLDSAHRFNQIKHLKNTLGNKIILIWIETELDIRKSRSGNASTELLSKDLMKWNRGMGNLKPESDKIISNNGTLLEFEEDIKNVFNEERGHFKPKTKNVEDYSLPTEIKGWLLNAIELFKKIETIKMVSLTGSAEANRWTQNWSDLDILMVCDNPENENLIHLLRHLIPLSGIKIAVTRVSTGELKALNLQPRIINTLCLLTQKKACVLYQSPSFFIPNITVDENRRSSLSELPFAIAILRRLLIDNPLETKKIYKQCLVILKILLRAEYIFLDSPDEVIKKYNFLKKQSLPLLTPENLISLTEYDANNNTLLFANTILKDSSIKINSVIRSRKEKVRGILIIDNSLVLIKRTVNEVKPYFVFPGGTIENSDLNNLDALFRELYEEIEADVNIICPLFVLQNEENIESFWLCDLKKYSISGGKGEEFRDSTRGLYEIVEIPLDREAILSFNIKPQIIKEKIVDLIPYFLNDRNLKNLECEWINTPTK